MRKYGEMPIHLTGQSLAHGAFRETFEVGFTSTKYRYRRKAKKIWSNGSTFYKFCQVSGAWNLPTFGNLTHSLAQD